LLGLASVCYLILQFFPLCPFLRLIGTLPPSDIPSVAFLHYGHTFCTKLFAFGISPSNYCKDPELCDQLFLNFSQISTKFLQYFYFRSNISSKVLTWVPPTLASVSTKMTVSKLLPTNKGMHLFPVASEASLTLCLQKPYHSFLCCLYREWASHRWRRQEPICHESFQHCLRRQAFDWS